MSYGSLFLSARPLVALLLGASVLLACTVEQGKKRRRAPAVPGDDYWAGDTMSAELPIEPDKVNENSGAFGAGQRPSSSGNVAGKDGGTTNPIGTKIYCKEPLVAGDLAVTEMMIASASGSGDWGEWVEIQSRRDCWLKLKGLSVESPRGALAPNVATITGDFDLPPNGTFVVADSLDPAKNRGIGGKVIAWNAADVLKNDGDTIILKLGGTTVETITYPALRNLEPGRSLSFPSDCAWTERKSWSRWSLTFDEYSTGLRGTPNEPNDDVSCF